MKKYFIIKGSYAHKKRTRIDDIPYRLEGCDVCALIFNVKTCMYFVYFIYTVV